MSATIIICVYQKDNADTTYEEELEWEGKELFATEEEGMTAIEDAWTYWSADAGENLLEMKLVKTLNKTIVHSYKINNKLNKFSVSVLKANCYNL